MRVISGRFGGRRLVAPPGRGTRPTSERVREAVFSMLGPVEAERVLDLFAGSGALGLEALSRGASEATFVDSAGAAIRAIRRNLEALGISAEVHQQPALEYLRRASSAPRQYDLVFLDPPYASIARLSQQLGPLLGTVLAPGARVVLESARGGSSPLELPLVRERTYGDTLIRIYESK